MASRLKAGLGVDVLTAARERLAWTFETFDRVYVSFSGGKDSTVLLDLTAEAARRAQRKFGLLFIDLEGQYKLTIDHVRRCFERYADVVDGRYWVCLPLILRNAVSQFEPRWICWDPSKRAAWIREPEPGAITDQKFFPFYRYAMEFEEFVEEFGSWYAAGGEAAALIAIRADESLNRFRTLMMERERHSGLRWTARKPGGAWNVYPIYDWRTEDLWTYHARTGAPYNPLYDRMYLAGLSIHQMRICQPYGDDQRKGLHLFQVIEPETWGRVVARVNGANQGALYAHKSGNMAGNIRVSKPEGHTWQSFARLLLQSMPEHLREHYGRRIDTFIYWWAARGITVIPDEVDPKREAPGPGRLPSWRRICKALLRNDYWCKGLSFSQLSSTDPERYKRLVKRRREKHGWSVYERLVSGEWKEMQAGQ
jgi:predicted phosphoadenosine phosphosulfate sulfurtransferase